MWKQIPGYEHLYSISDSGLVRSEHRRIVVGGNANAKTRSVPERVLRPNEDRYGYLCVTLQREGVPKTFKIHRLVAAAFIGKSKSQINHKDCNKKNNRVENLEYVTASENFIHALRNGLVVPKSGSNHYAYRITPEMRQAIKGLRGKCSIADIGERFGIHPMTCYKIWSS